MTRTFFTSLGALAFTAAALAPLGAQGATQSVRLAFGYECGDRFLVHNDGPDPVVVEYAPAGSQDKSQLHLNGKQSAEIASAQSGDMELWVGGKLVASEPKGDIPCAAASGNGAVTVQPIDPNASAPAQIADSTNTEYTAPPVVVYAPGQYDYYYPYSYYPYSYYPYAYYGFSPFFRPSITIRGRAFGGRFGGRFGGGVRRGPAVRGRGRR